MALDDRFRSTISRNRFNVFGGATSAQPFEIEDAETLQQAMETDYRLPMLLNKGQEWSLPAGAYGSEGCGASYQAFLSATTLQADLTL